MAAFNIKESVLKITNSQKGVSLNEIIDYLDYVNKVRYSEDEINEILKELSNEGKVHFNKQLWLKS